MLGIGLCSGVRQSAPKYDSTSRYEQRRMQGFRVYINRKALEHPQETKEALALLDTKLAEIVAMLASDRLKPLQRVAFWVEWEAHPNRGMEYHLSKDWLQENGYNPEKVRCVEIVHVRNFIAWTENGQPLMVLHELAHAYHHNVLGIGHPAVEEAFERAMAKGLYGEVDYRYKGQVRKRQAYAATNSQEYFAELTEAYFGVNDFFPFHWRELKEYDPTGFALMEQVWGKPRRRALPKTGSAMAFR
jgi:hypothetical protein